MLTDLRIRNVAIIEEVSLVFGDGLNLLTGETGAGKSIIVDALTLVSGGKADSHVVRSGCAAAVVEATFERIPPAAVRFAEERGADVEDGTVILRREVSSDGKSRAFVGGAGVPVSALRHIGEMLIDLHGQHQSRTLLKAEAHLASLDDFGGLEELRARVGGACRAVREAARRLEETAEALRDRDSRLEFLRFQEREIGTADPKEGEEGPLKAERARLSHATRIAELSALVQGLLCEGEGSALERIGGAARALDELARFDPSSLPLVEKLAEARFSLEDVASGVRAGIEIEADPDRLDRIESRLALLAALGRKHGGDAGHLLRRRDELALDIARLEEGGRALDGAKRDLQQATDEYLGAASELSALRSKAASKLSAAMTSELSALAFERMLFEIPVRTRRGEGGAVFEDGEPPMVSEEGFDVVEFMISPNQGEPSRPLVRIASGGELSRVMLALNVALGKQRPAVAIVFDEVDSGIGGRTAEAVGERLARLGEERQVLCVTHLPQIACRAASHWSVSKEEKGGRTVVAVRRLDSEGRVEELARMLAGREVTQAAVRHARELVLGSAGPSRSTTPKTTRKSA